MMELKQEKIIGYVANDGTQFSNKTECEIYEACANEKKDKLYHVLLHDKGSGESVVYVVWACCELQAKVLAKKRISDHYYSVVSAMECVFDEDGTCEVYYG